MSRLQFLPALWHEAAHAVVAALSSAVPAVDHVRVNFDGRGGVQYSAKKPPARTRQAVRQRMYETQRVLYAGAIAETLATGKAEGFEGDRVKLLALIERDHLFEFTSPGVPFTEGALRRSYAHARARTLTAAAASEFLVRSRWGAVERVAHALMRCSAISGELLRVLIENAPKVQRFTEADHTRLLRAASGDRQVAQEQEAACQELARALDAVARKIPVPRRGAARRRRSRHGWEAYDHYVATLRAARPARLHGRCSTY